MSIRKQLEQAIIDSRMEQQELADASGVARSTLWYLSAGKHSCTSAVGDKIAAGLGMRWVLFFGDENKGGEMAGIADQLREYIKMSGHSQRSIARKAGVRESTLSAFLADRREGLVGTIDDLTEALGLEWRLIEKEQK
jgi:transcriptional regulator with XRE-family HTH domain